MIWSEAFIESLAAEAVGQIAIDVNCIWARECVATTQGISVIRLPNYVRTLSRITWRGWSLDPVGWDGLLALTPATVFAATDSPDTNTDNTVQGRPLYYAMHPTNPYDIRLFPTPNESFTIGGESDPYSPTTNSSSCIISYWRKPDEATPLTSLPSYILRRTQKAFVLWHAFAAEGPGQNLKASVYYKRRYEFLVNRFRLINEGCFIGKRYVVDDGTLSLEGYVWPKPTLPPNFERVRLR